MGKEKANVGYLKIHEDLEYQSNLGKAVEGKTGNRVPGEVYAGVPGTCASYVTQMELDLSILDVIRLMTLGLLLYSLSKILPEYDEERIYPSDLKKFFTWYNLLIKLNPEMDFKVEEKGDIIRDC